MDTSRRLPYVPPPTPGESFASWIGRVAGAYGLTPRELMICTGAPDDEAQRMLSRKALFYKLPSPTRDHVTETLGIAGDELAQMQLCRYERTWLDGADPQLRVLPSAWFRRRMLDPAASKACAQCDEDGLGRQLLWSVQLSFLCERHQCWLEESGQLLHRPQVPEHLVAVQHHVRSLLEANIDDPEGATANWAALQTLRSFLKMVLLTAPACGSGEDDFVRDEFDRFVTWRESGGLRQLSGRDVPSPLDAHLVAAVSAPVVAAALAMTLPMVQHATRERSLGDFVDVVTNSPDPQTRLLRLFGSLTGRSISWQGHQIKEALNAGQGSSVSRILGHWGSSHELQTAVVRVLRSDPLTLRLSQVGGRPPQEDARWAAGVARRRKLFAVSSADSPGRG